MFSRSLTLLSVLSLLFVSSAYAETGASWLRTRMSNALNPKISVIADFVYQSGPGRDNKFSLRETELAFQSEVDPTTRADFFVAFPEEEAVELEEAYITLLALPLGFQGRGGKFLANFGRLNVVHDHELPQVDRPLVLGDYLGEEGLNDVGAEISRIFTPLGIFTEVSYGFLNGLGEEEEEPATATVTDTDGNTVTVQVQGEEESSKRNIRDFGQVGRLRFFKDLTENADLELAVSGALHQPKEGTQKEMGGFDFTYRWKPVREGGAKSITLRGEGIYSNRELQDAPKKTVERFGGYAYLEIKPKKQWSFGTRGDYVEAPESRTFSVTRAVSPYITFYANEFNRYRAQYQFKDIPGTQDQHIFWLQWTVIVGPHGAHAY